MTAEVTQLITIEAAEHVAESPFYIPMTGPATRRRRSLERDDTFIVLDSHGDIGASAGGPDGLFNADTRYLARLEMVLDEVQPLLLGSNLRDDNSALTVDLTNSDVCATAGWCCRRTPLHIVRLIFLSRGTAYRRIALQNRGNSAASSISAYCSTMISPGPRPARPRRGWAGPGCSAPPMSYWISGSTVSSTTPLHFDRVTRRSSALVAGEEATGLSRSRYPATADDAEAGAVLPQACSGASSRYSAGRHAAGVDVERMFFDEVLLQAIADLDMLMTRKHPTRRSLCSVPLRTGPAVRPRPADRTLRMLSINPRIAQGVYRRLAFFQAQTTKTRSPMPNPANSCTEIHSQDEMVTLHEVPFGAIYGSVRRPGCSCCSAASMSSAPATTKTLLAELSPRWRRRCNGSTAMPAAGFISPAQPPSAAQPARRIPGRDLSPCRWTARRRLLSRWREVQCLRRQAAGGALTASR